MVDVRKNAPPARPDDGYLESLREEPKRDSTTAVGWGYLGFLALIFVALALFAYQSGGSSGVGTGAGDAGEGAVEAAKESVELAVSISGDSITVDGSVPDQPALDQLVGEIEGIYGQENIVDQLTVSDSTTLDGGIVRISGEALEGDSRPEDLRQAIVAAFNLGEGAFDVEFTSEISPEAAVTFTVEGEQVALSGVVPDEPSIDDLTTAATEVWGEGNVDASGLTVGSSRWDGAKISVVGSVLEDDDRAAELPALIEADFGPNVTVDLAGISGDAEVAAGAGEEADGEAEVAAAEEEVRTAVEAEPILFRPSSADIEPESNVVIERVAKSINGVPEAKIEVVGHTDSEGVAAENQKLSDERSAAVVARLVELGVDEARLSASGKGDTEPIADNETVDGRAVNRRIEFSFVVE